MEKRRFLQRWRTSRLGEPGDHPEGVRTAYALYETAWANAWPHLDDWFKAGTLLRECSGNRPL